MKSKKCLFLGYDTKKTSLIKFLRVKKISVVENRNKILNYKTARKFDFLISFGYRKIISKKLIQKLKRPIINLHISYLPYNRGAHPNFWSFINKTPKGVSIHEIDKGIDTGRVLFRKKITFFISKKTTFRTTYKILIREIEIMFKKNYKSIIEGKYKGNKQLIRTKLNKKKDLPRRINWDTSISDFISFYKS